MNNLLTYLLEQTARWAWVFPQERSLQRALALAFGILCGMGRRTLTRAISFHGHTQKDWWADYQVFSRSPWEARALFHPILEQAIQEQKLPHIVISTDDTRVWRNGKHVPQTQWHRDPLGPPFQTNLRWGHRFLQASLVLPLYPQDGESSSRSIPVRFELAPVVKKPGKKAGEADGAEYRRQKKEKNLSVQFVLLTQELRQRLNQTGHHAQRRFQMADGSFCDRTVWGRTGRRRTSPWWRAAAKTLSCASGHRERAAGSMARLSSPRKRLDEAIPEPGGRRPRSFTAAAIARCVSRK